MTFLEVRAIIHATRSSPKQPPKKGVTSQEDQLFCVLTPFEWGTLFFFNAFCTPIGCREFTLWATLAPNGQKSPKKHLFNQFSVKQPDVVAGDPLQVGGHKRYWKKGHSGCFRLFPATSSECFHFSQTGSVKKTAQRLFRAASGCFRLFCFEVVLSFAPGKKKEKKRRLYRVGLLRMPTDRPCKGGSVSGYFGVVSTECFHFAYWDCKKKRQQWLLGAVSGLFRVSACILLADWYCKKKKKGGGFGPFRAV